MYEQLQRIKELIGTKELGRVLEVMKIFGLSFPNDFKIYRRDDLDSVFCGDSYEELREKNDQNYVVLLSNNEQEKEILEKEEVDELGYFEFNDHIQILGFRKDDLSYEWEKNGSTREYTYETLSIKRDNQEGPLLVWFVKRNAGILSSELYLEGNPYAESSLGIESYISNVKVKDSNTETSIENYFEFFKQLLADKRFNYVIPDNLQNEEIINTILQVFEQPINKLVLDLTNYDQSWRYAQERESIVNNYEYSKRLAKERLDQIVTKANNNYKLAVQRIEDSKESGLQELDIQEKKYTSSRKKLVITK